jgi:hypothetical protein
MSDQNNQFLNFVLDEKWAQTKSVIYDIHYQFRIQRCI